MAGIRIDELDATVLPSRDHVVPAMKDGLTVKLTVGQILDLLGKVLDPDEVGSKALFAALNLSDLDDPEQARENLGATEIGDALFTAVSKEAARSTIDALGPSETADKAFRRGNIIGTVSQDGGIPTGAIIERGSNANGEYVRWADGTQICWRPINVNSNSYVTFTMPSAFSDAGYFAVANQNFENPNLLSVKVGNRTTTTANVAIIDSNGFTTSGVMSLFAVGRWF